MESQVPEEARIQGLADQGSALLGAGAISEA